MIVFFEIPDTGNPVQIDSNQEFVASRFPEGNSYAFARVDFSQKEELGPYELPLLTGGELFRIGEAV